MKVEPSASLSFKEEVYQAFFIINHPIGFATGGSIRRISVCVHCGVGETVNCGNCKSSVNIESLGVPLTQDNLAPRSF
jgi:hypothetical protein